MARVAVLVDDTAFDGSWLYSSAGSVKGGHVYFSYSDDVTNTNTTIRRSNFTNGILTNSGGRAVGGCYFEYGATATKAHQQIESCVFRNNTLVGSDVTGGGVAVFMRGESTEMAFIILLCLFAHNVLRGGEDGGAQGAGVYMQFHGGAVRSVLLLVERSTFESNVASARLAMGAGCYFHYFAAVTKAHQQIESCVFRNNTLVGSDVTGGGVLMLMEGESTEMTFIILLCLFAHNVLWGVVNGVPMVPACTCSSTVAPCGPCCCWSSAAPSRATWRRPV
jgi:hypothetical protein